MLDLNFKQYSNIIENNDNKKLISIHNWLFETVNDEPQGFCPKCGKNLVIRINKANQNQFLGCKGFPNCKYTTGYNPNKSKNIVTPQQSQPQPAGQVQQKQWWFYAEVITDSDPRFKIKEKVALRKFDNYKWQYITLINGNAGYVDNDDLQNVFKSILKNGTKLKTPDNPSLKDLINQDPDLAVEFQTTTASDKAKGMIKDSMMSEEQKAIEQKFENIINGKSKNHIMINALAGTGKTTMLRHLAWKYGSPSQNWLYIVFNNKNKVEATEKFPSFVTVRTTNGFLGEVLSNKNNSTAIKKTHRIVNLENDDVKKLQKIRVIADSPVFEEIMNKYKLPSKIPNNLGIDNDYQLNAFRSFLNIVKFSYKEQVVKLAGLLKSNALDPRKSENLVNKATEIFNDYDFDENFSKAQEKLEGWSRNERFFEEMNQIIKNNFGFEFGSIDYKLEIIHGAIWILEESMPGFTKAKYKSKDKNHDLSDYRDFDDDLWYTAIHSNEINWPKFDVVLADEIQDFNENQKIMLQKMASQGSIVVAVGDPNQCVIEGTLIETDNGEIPIEQIKVGSNVMCGKGNGNKTVSSITDLYVREIKSKVVKITTKSGKVLTTTPEHTHFAGFETNNIEKYFVYLMYKENMGYRIGITKNYRSNVKNGYKGRLNQERADKIWLIDQFDTKAQAQIYEQYYSVLYGIPSVVFYRNSNQKFSQEDINELFEKIDTKNNAIKLLNDKFMFLDHPHHVPKCMNRKRYRNFNIVLCGDPRGTGLHRYSVAGTDEINLNKNIKLRKAKHGWRLESSNSDLGKIYEILNEVNSNNNINVIEKARLTNVTLSYMPASHVREGMDIYVSENNKIILDIVDKVEIIDYVGKVYDINVDKFHNFIANGIVTHNSLYRFRGADANSFSNISGMLKNVSGNGEDIEQTLTKNFRSKKYIIDFANEETHVKNLKSGLTDSEESANGKISKFEKDYQDAFRELINEKEANGHVKETAFIARTNDPLIHAALTLLSNNIPFIIIGKDIANDIKKELQNIIYHFKLNDDSEVSSLKNMIIKYVEGYNEKYSGSAARKDFLKELEEVTNTMLATISQFEESQEQKTIGKYKKWINVKLGGFDIEESEKDYAEYKKRMEKEKPIVLITAHRSKGLEFERVFILRYDHFPHPTAKREKDKAQEANAKYVAITRAKEELHIIKLKGQPGYKPPKDEDF